jgi:hypothetical protein
VNEHEPLTRSACSTARLDAAIDDHALSVGRFLDSDQPEAPSASLMAAPALALPMLARSAMRASRMTACTAIASAFKRSAASGRPSKPAIFPVSQWGCRTSPAGCAARHEMALIRVCHSPCRRERMREPVPLNPACEDTGGEVSHAWRARRRLQPRPVARTWAGLG